MRLGGSRIRHQLDLIVRDALHVSDELREFKKMTTLTTLQWRTDRDIFITYTEEQRVQRDSGERGRSVMEITNFTASGVY